MMLLRLMVWFGFEFSWEINYNRREKKRIWKLTLRTEFENEGKKKGKFYRISVELSEIWGMWSARSFRPLTMFKTANFVSNPNNSSRIYLCEGMYCL